MAGYVERRLAGQPVDRLTGVLRFMNSSDRSKLMPALVEYTTSLDAIRGTDLLETLPELEPAWRGYAAAT